MRRVSAPAGRALIPATALVVLSIFSAGAAWAQFPPTPVGGPWVQTKNGYYATARLAWGSGSSFYDANGTVTDYNPALDFKGRTVTLDSEYGVSNRLTMHLAMPVEFLSFTVPAFSQHSTNNGFGDLLFGFKYGFLDAANKAALALEVDANTPSGYNAHGFGNPSLGRGKFSVDGHLHAGITFDPTPAYVQAELGYRKFTDTTTAPAITYGGEVGVHATDRVLVVAHLEAEKGKKDVAKPNTLSYTQAEGLVQYGVTPHCDVMAGYRRTLSGENYPKRSELRLGVALKGNGLGRNHGQTAAATSALPVAKMAPAPAAAPTPSAIPAPTPAPSDTTHAPDQPK